MGQGSVSNSPGLFERQTCHGSWYHFENFATIAEKNCQFKYLWGTNAPLTLGRMHERMFSEPISLVRWNFGDSSQMLRQSSFHTVGKNGHSSAREIFFKTPLKFLNECSFRCLFGNCSELIRTVKKERYGFVWVRKSYVEFGNCTVRN